MTYQQIGSINSFFKKLYNDFNDRNIEAVIAMLSDDVKWANGMEGGFVYGREGVREYWLRQFTMVTSQVTPEEIRQVGDQIQIRVKQVVHDNAGNLLSDTHVTHIFTLNEQKIHQFEIGN
jgi:ketosteroid isomerase-like protein